MKTVVCFGASLTEGTVSYNYLDLLAAHPSLKDFRFINRGRNGDLAWSGLQRLDRVIADEPDYVSILIGTNDVNATLSDRNRMRYIEFYQAPQDPTMEWYEENLREIVARLKRETTAKLALISLAVIGEDLEHMANRQVARYNEVIQRIATQEEVPYLPLNETMITYLRAHEADRMAPRLEYRDGLHNIANATALHGTGMSWDEISSKNGLLVTTDTLHLNSVGAGMIADLIAAWLLRESTAKVSPAG
jgi:lysophospholipase L1-like esterase